MIARNDFYTYVDDMISQGQCSKTIDKEMLFREFEKRKAYSRYDTEMDLVDEIIKEYSKIQKQKDMIISNDEMQMVLNAIGDVELAEKLEAIFEEHNERHRVGRVNIQEQKNIVMAALNECIYRQCLGSLGNEEASNLYYKLKYEDYCVKRGITYEQMDDMDYEQYEAERRREYEYDSNDTYYEITDEYDDYEY